MKQLNQFSPQLPAHCKSTWELLASSPATPWTASCSTWPPPSCMTWHLRLSWRNILSTVLFYRCIRSQTNIWIYFFCFQNEQENASLQNWSLICDLLLSRGLEPGVLFQLRQGEVLLLCEVIAIPHFNITEQVMNVNQDKFILNGNPTSPV